MASAEVLQDYIPLYAFVGPEGSGKTLQARMLAQKLGLLYFSTGDFLREVQLNDHSEFGDDVREMFKSNRYLDPQKILKVIGQKFCEEQAKNGVVLDGGFRTLEETLDFQKMLDETGCKFKVRVFYLRIPLWRGMERALARPSRGDGQDVDLDTKIRSLLGRLSKFCDKLGPRMCYIRDHFRLIMIVDGNRTAEEINEQVIRETQACQLLKHPSDSRKEN